ncbi:Type I restriction enzyme specificity protein MG438 [Chryseobacterium nakagawai]|uniref:Restriction endonuclease subunit S n=1 Tax=Chryseobacterium nakagawai TaxID=1241982 RepID=A0AAD1DTA1_CHRNA|nr:restriction endonuclease subunit S [Chryseobacterium nakagawai]AZA93621.1 restriction endonuclease subunit S [Chryseobacterium nakagawai]VEH20323.1 Type I restriction enzyme specificity protein MG438 [Chryseobacterium nakagawai]
MKKLGEVTEGISSGKSKNINIQGQYPFYGSTGIISTSDKFDYFGKKILIARVGANAGFIYKVDGKFAVSDNTLILYPKDEISLDFIFNYLIKYNLNKLIFGSGQPLITGGQLKLIEFKLPSIKEQEKISSLFSLTEKRIQTQKKIIDNLEYLMLGFREKTFKKKLRFKDGLGNDFPDWEESKLENICQKQSSNISANKIEDNFGNYIIYGASGILKKIDFYEEENDYISIVKDGAGVGRLFFCEGQSSVLGTMEIIKPKLDVNVQFLYCQLSNIDFKKYVTGSTIPHIYFKDYKKESIKIPSLEEQTKIANFLFSIDKKLETEKKILAQYKTQKKYLLANLFV